MGKNNISQTDFFYILIDKIYCCLTPKSPKGDFAAAILTILLTYPPFRGQGGKNNPSQICYVIFKKLLNKSYTFAVK